MKIGLLGGTFDPVHAGHLHIARHALERMALDQIHLVVARTPPHKPGESVTDASHRFAMAVLATADDPRLLVSPWELNRPGPGYTIDTLQGMRGEFPNHQFCFVAGGDSLREIHLWKDCGTLLREYCFVFVRRPGFGPDLANLEIPGSLKRHIRTVCENETPAIRPGSSFLLVADPPPVSSTQIREAIAAGGQPPPGSIPPEVAAHIWKYRLYEQNPRSPGKSLRRHQQ